MLQTAVDYIYSLEAEIFFGSFSQPYVALRGFHSGSDRQEEGSTDVGFAARTNILFFPLHQENITEIFISTI